ncbi:hypothetical protein ACKKBF_B02420 [Auxenochlorella protothecoides x Auxenochlorella symbiontica]
MFERFKDASVVNAHPDGIPNLKKGTLYTGAIHIFCGIVGAGVLALPRSLGWLGWVAGPLLIIAFYFMSLTAAWLLADCYEVDGVENGRYHDIVNHIMGKKWAYGVSTFQLLNIVLIDIAYTITAGKAMVTLANTACGWQGIDADACFDKSWAMTVIFGGVQIVSSQVPNLESAWWVSAIGTLTSLFYASVALVLGLKSAHNRLGSVAGIPATPVNKAFSVMSSLGAIGFAYTFSTILVEIQDTLKQPPKASKTMSKAISISVTGAFVFYFLVAVGGYASLGDAVPGYILGGLVGPEWVIFAANFAVLGHMWSAYQIFAHPMFDTLESHIKAFHLRRAKARGDTELPAKVEEMKRASLAAKTAPLDAKATDLDAKAPGAAPAGGEPQLRRLSRVSAMSTAASQGLQRLSQSAAMYRVSTGFVNESVPSNEEHFLLPIWQRILTRTFYVCFTTIIAVVMPFFGSMAGLVGALAFFPLTIFFPIECWRKVYKPRGFFNGLLYSIEAFMFAVCILSTVSSMRNIINSWSTFKIFGATVGLH